MKKLISVLCALTLLTANSQMAKINAVDNSSMPVKPNNTNMIKDTDLSALASSLGADTDYMSIANYYHNEDDMFSLVEKYTDYFWNCSVIEAAYNPNGTFSTNIKSGSSIGIAILEVLSHNQVIKPSDIQTGATALNEVSYDDEVDKIITNYQLLQGYTEFNNYTNFIKTTLSYDEQITKLIETAENSMTNDKYFFISVSGADNFSNAVCGIGVAYGIWEWNGEEYDTCILTLDSNENTNGFNENSCIYINSETKRCYIPSHEVGTDNNLSFVTIDDDTLLNYKGAINPSETINTDISNIKHITYDTTSNTKLYTINNGVTTLFDETSSNEQSEKVKYIEADAVHINMNDELTKTPHFRYINSDRWINVELQNDDLEKTYNAHIDIADDMVRIKCNKDEIDNVNLQIRMNEGTYDYSPYFWWDISLFDFDNEVDVEVRENGILLKNNGNNIKATVTPYCYLPDENGNFQFDSSYINILTGSVEAEEKSAFIETDRNVLISVENQEIVYYIDKNFDDVYDDVVEKGDVNCDGVINASDASLILSKYASSSSNSSQYVGIGNNLGDYNGDGVINASDASEVLAYYAEMSSGASN